ncbi:MAG: uroporphyrinogen decarboxylase family protein [Armatimonadota bacterium]
MNHPRERVLQTLNYERPDRTPRDFWAEAPALERLCQHLQVSDEEGILQALEIDFRHLNAIEPAPRETQPGVWQNYWGERFLYLDSGHGMMREDLPGALAGVDSDPDCRAADVCVRRARTAPNLACDQSRRGASPRPTEEGDIPNAFLSFPWPSPDLFDYSQLAGQVGLHERYALVYGFADVWQRAALVRGWERMFMDMARAPHLLHFLCRKFVDFYKEDYTRAQEQAGGRIDLFLLLSDLGSQHGPLMSLVMFRSLVAPYLTEMIAHIHSLGARVLYHTCGAVTPFIPDLIALGVDVLDPLQPVNEEMQPESLQANFGGQVVFHGGIHMQTLLPWGTPEEVTAEARRYCEVLGANGGYILAPTHLFQPDVPPENVVAMYR